MPTSMMGSSYGINGGKVTPPDEEVWSKIVLGEDLQGQERRSPVQRLQWRKTVAERCDLDWFDFDGLRLTSITTTPPGEVGTHATYVHWQRCVSVTSRSQRGVGREITATFLIDPREVAGP